MELSRSLADAPDAVRVARRFVADSLRGTGAEGCLAEAELVVTELVTNAVMHVGPPVTVSLRSTDDLVRLEVADRSRVAPVRGLGGPEAMTGRGLALVDAVCSRWGVDAGPGGKTVWAEVRAGSAGAGGRPEPRPTAAAPLEREPGAWAQDAAPAAEARHTVVLGDVPTDLLLQAKGHVDNLVREFSLAVTGAAAGQSAPVTPRLAGLIERVTTQFAEARAAIKRQALAAAAAGEERTRLVLTLPVSAAAAGVDYLAALDEADTYARAARLLTLETPPQHRAFRRWYVTAVGDQLRAIERGEPRRPPPSFEQFLLDELEVVARAQRVADRAARLQAVTSSLAGAATPEDVAAVVVSEGVDALGAFGGGLLVPGDEDHLAVPGTVGYDEDVVAALRVERPTANLPAADALRRGDPIWLESAPERDAQYPELVGLEPATVSMCAVPLRRGGRVLGALRLSFDVPRLFDPEERAFVMALAAQTAQALDRTELHRVERDARARAETVATRLARLHRVTALLAAARDEDEVAGIVTSEAVGTLGATAAALTVFRDPTTLRVVAAHGAEAVRDRWQAFPVDSALPAAEAVRTSRPVVARSRAEIEARFPALADVLPREGSYVCVPLPAGEGAIGALSLAFPPEDPCDDEEVELLATIGQQCSVALERGRLLAATRRARERAAYLADATARLASSLEPTETLQHLTDLLVPVLADWALVYLVNDSGLPEAAGAAHRDPAVAEAILTAHRARALQLDAPGGLGEVLRSGRTVRHTRVPRGVATRIAGFLADVEEAGVRDVRSAMGVPLTAAGGRVLGALALVRTGDDPYTEDDQHLVEGVAARAAVAVDHAEQFRRERDAAVTLQRSLLPQRFPRVEGVSVAWRYLPGSAGTHVGGDWYDVVPLEKGRVALVIGDVMGRGLRAAAVMGQLRATARAHVSADVDPATVLERLDAAVRGLEQEPITTALLCVLDPAARTLTLASAGHLPPLVTADDTGASFLPVEPGPPLGAGYEAGLPLEVTLPAGATLLLFTDGLVEDRTLPVDRGLDLLLAAASGSTDPESLCDGALAALGRDTAHDDDTAVLAVRLLTP